MVSVKPVIELSGDRQELSLFQVGRISASVTDQDGAVIKQVKLMVVPKVDADVVDITASSLYAPVAKTIDDDGAHTLFPVPADGVDPRFHVIAMAEGYCPYVSEELIYEESKPSEISIVLELCPDASSQTPSIQLAFENSIKTQTENDLTTGFVNSSEFKLNFKSLSSQMRGFRVLVYEGARAEGIPFWTPATIYTLTV